MTRVVAGVVLAAGASTRMGPGRRKLLEEVGGQALIRWPVEALARAGIDPIVVVTAAGDEALGAVLEDHPVEYVEVPEVGPAAAGPAEEAGLGRSIAVGVEVLARIAPGCDGMLIVLGDLPLLRSAHLRPLIAAFEQAGPEAICVPVWAGRRGHPVLFDAAHGAALRSLGGDIGARALLARHADRVIEVPAPDAGILEDVDTPEALERARRQISSGTPNRS